MNRKINITCRIGKRHHPLIWNDSGTLKPDLVKIDGVETKRAGGTFYLSWYTGRKLNYKSVGTNPTHATNRRLALISGLEKGVPA
jgi:hypothetical protein